MGLFDSLRSREKKVTGDLVFKDNTSAFEHACEYMDCRIVVGASLIALVKTADFNPDGRQSCTLLLESDDGGREILLCETLNERVPILKVGDLVAYQVIGYFPESRSKIAQLSIPGFIVAKLKPAYSVDYSGWRVAKE